ncbi:MAG: hypothetical protein IJ371_06500 [Clostridia bacterium]|nr:hypothetical protein [Clostridia bacterium]MBQ8425767.1 hypothetical protein [Clostridia bacterium]
MYVDKNSLVINGINMGQYIVEAKFSYPRLWASDSGRNLAGKMTGTLIGIFPKIILQFRPLTREELNIIAPILDSANQTVTYYDPKENKNITMTTYTGDWELTNNNLNQNQGFSCSFISVEKRA